MNNNNFEEGNTELSYPDFEKFPVLNNKNIEKFQSLTNKQPEILREIMQSFIDESSDLLSDIEKAINEKELKKFQEHVHTLKGLFATIGASKLFEISKFMDEHNKQKNFDVARKLLPKLKINYKEVKVIIKEKFLQ